MSERQGKGLIQETLAGIKHEKTSQARLMLLYSLFSAPGTQIHSG